MITLTSEKHNIVDRW